MFQMRLQNINRLLTTQRTQCSISSISHNLHCTTRIRPVKKKVLRLKVGERVYLVAIEARSASAGIKPHNSQLPQSIIKYNNIAQTHQNPILYQIFAKKSILLSAFDDLHATYPQKHPNASSSTMPRNSSNAI